MRAENCRSVVVRFARLFELSSGDLDLTEVRRDESGLIGNDTVTQQSSTHFDDFIGVSAQDVNAAEAIYLSVDESGNNDARTWVRQTDGLYLATVNRNVTWNQFTVNEGRAGVQARPLRRMTVV